MELTGRVIRGGAASGPLLVLEEPLSFWGGVDPGTGTVIDPRHPQRGETLGGRILVMERAIGSSSSSAIMLELIRNDVAPAGLVLGEVDAILVLGVLVADRLGYSTPPVLQVQDLAASPAWVSGHPAEIDGPVMRIATQPYEVGNRQAPPGGGRERAGRRSAPPSSG